MDKFIMQYQNYGPMQILLSLSNTNTVWHDFLYFVDRASRYDSC